jgi:hypothetical protein
MFYPCSVQNCTKVPFGGVREAVEEGEDVLVLADRENRFIVIAVRIADDVFKVGSIEAVRVWFYRCLFLGDTGRAESFDAGCTSVIFLDR